MEYDPYNAIVVDSEHLHPVRSNLGLDQPLRPKPPSDGVFHVTPSPNYYQHQQQHQYGVDNPHYYSQKLDNVGSLKTNADPIYGPGDFVVETVKLDKDFFHHFFTSKPLLLGTDVVTSTSMKINRKEHVHNNALKKRGREAIDETPQIDIPIVNSKLFIQSKLQEMAKYHSENEGKYDGQVLTNLMMVTSTEQPTTTTTIPAKKAKEGKPANNVKIFKRYHIPAEVQISHGLSMN